MGADLQMNTRLTPGLQAMLPLLYAAWADRHLNLKEINALRKRAADLPFLTEADKQLLLVWSDPARPPERELFQQWQTMGRNAAEQLPADRAASLAELGALLGHAAEGQPSDRTDFWQQQVAPLTEIEKGLGGVNETTYRGLFPRYDEREKLVEAVREASVDPAALQRVLDGKYADTIARTKEILLRPAFKREKLPVKEDYREQVLEWCKILGQEGLGALACSVRALGWCYR